VNSLRILIADDHDLVRRGIRELLQSYPVWSICAEAKTGRDAVAKSEVLKPDIAILDVSMPDLNGLEATRKIRIVSPRTEVLILTMHNSDHLTREILDTGARGYILKSDSARDLAIAIETLAKHKPFFTSNATEVILKGFKRGGSIAEGPELIRDQLTPREREIIQLLAEGRTSKEVATALSIKVKTAETHRSNIMRKLEIHTTSELVRYAIHNHIIEA
jgi:DNA-binding NarL/FixJ family response regulator